MKNTSTAAYGGPGWSPRTTRLVDEIGSIWGDYSVASECSPLDAVLIHQPGAELANLNDPDQSQMLAAPNPDLLNRQHLQLADAYGEQGVEVFYVEPSALPTPNQMFVADLMFMTPSGVILGRPASTVRAGEERWVARRLADLGVPIIRSVGGNGTFEGADAAWLNPSMVLVGRGLRTNSDGAAQVSSTLWELGIASQIVDLPNSAMHLMGSIRIVDNDLAFVRSGGLPWTAIEVLRQNGFEVRFFPSEDEMTNGMGHNFVTLAPRKVLMPAGNPLTKKALNEVGVTTVTVDVGEVAKAAGAIGCLTGILSREAVAR